MFAILAYILIAKHDQSRFEILFFTILLGVLVFVFGTMLVHKNIERKIENPKVTCIYFVQWVLPCYRDDAAQLHISFESDQDAVRSLTSIV